MKGHIRQRNGKWRYIVYYQDENGNNKQSEKVVDGTKADAERELRKAITEIENGLRKNRNSVEFLLNEYLATVKQKCKFNTYKHYEGIVRLYLVPAIGKKKVHEVTVKNLINILDNAKCSGSRKQDIHGVMKAFFKYCFMLRMITYNPVDFVQRPKRKSKKFDVLNLEEYKILLAYCADHLKEDYTLYIFYVALQVELECGLRRGELAGLTWDNIDFENNVLTIEKQRVYINGHTYIDTPKTETSKRELYFSDELKALLIDYKLKQKKDRFYYQADYYNNIYDNINFDFVFVWEHGEAVHPLWFYKKLQKVLKECDINKKIRFHDLRHTNATLLLQSGIDIKTLQSRLGHADVTTTLNIYAHSDLEQQKKFIDKFKMTVSK